MNKLFLPALAFMFLNIHAQTSLPIKKVTLFKNATALVVKEGNAVLKNGSVSLPIPSQARFGAYFIGSAKDNSVKSIVFKNDTLKKQDVSCSVWQYLAGNMNKQVTISYTPTQGVDKTLSGKVVDYDLYSGILKFVSDAGKTTVMHVAQIYQADFKETPSPFYMADSIKRMMVLKAAQPAEAISLQEVYMTGGLNWIPSYFLKFKDEKNARLEMKATLENYAEELKDAETELVVGSPQMKYSGKLDPMTYDYLTVGYSDNSGNYAAKYVQNNTYTTTAETGGDMDGYFTTDFSTAGEKSDDIYIYKPGKISLPYSAKGNFPIFASNVEYKHKYEGTISDITNYYSLRYVQQEEKNFDVFHSIELKNTTNVPFTTASVMVMNEKEQFVAQDELKYTPAGASTTVRLSKAVDIIMKNAEEEKNREDNAKKIGKTVYSKVFLKGTVNIDNYQDKEVTVTITKTINGTVTEVKDGGKVAKKNPYSNINPQSEIKWEVKLASNQKKTLTYDYEVLFVP
jgi:hypothetical protein